MNTQNKRFLWRSGFFILFLIAPVANIFRFDLALNHLVVLGMPWHLGIDSNLSPAHLAVGLLLKFFLPLAILLVAAFYIAWRWGRLYCGWLCPHFSVVEAINGLMRRASGKPTLWEKQALPSQQKDGRTYVKSRWWWLATFVAVILFSFVWAVALLTYLINPSEIYHNLFTFQLTANQARFIGIATFLFIIEFTLARHLFCRFGCALGLFQSLIWMANKKSMVVAFDRARGKQCKTCDKSCELVCPMRLKPRGFKRQMFTCTQCMQCVDACDNVQKATASGPSLLKMLEGDCALNVSDRGLGRKPTKQPDCFTVDNKAKRSCDSGK